MHLHLGIKADGLENLKVHHVVVHRRDVDMTSPGNTCMVSIPSVLDPSLAPPKHHVIHAYTLEPWQGWQQRDDYAEYKRHRAETLYRALEQIIPDLRGPGQQDSRIVLELVGTPLTHQRFLRRYQGTYGPAIKAGEGMFPNCRTPHSRTLSGGRFNPAGHWRTSRCGVGHSMREQSRAIEAGFSLYLVQLEIWSFL